MKIISFFFILLCSLNSWSISVSFCPEKVDLTKYKDGEWRSVLPDNFEYSAKRFTPQQFGNWIEIQNSSKDTIVRNFDGSKLFEVVFSKDNCSQKPREINFPWYVEKHFKQKDVSDFDDSKLKSLLSSKENIIFYLWSPKFSYSVEYFSKAQKYASELGYKFVPLLDFSVDKKIAKETLIQNVASKNQRVIAQINEEILARNMSLDFYLRFADQHFPVMYVSKNGKIHPRWITGVMTEGGFKKMVADFAKDLK